MPQQSNGLGATLFKCVRCLHFICCAVMCRRCRPKRKADDVVAVDEDVVDVEGGQGPATSSFRDGDGATCDDGQVSPPGPAALYHQERQHAQPAPQHPPQQQPSRTQPFAAGRIAEATAPSQFAAAAEAAVPTHMATILDHHAGGAGGGGGDSEDEEFSDEQSDEEDDEEDHSGGCTPGLLAAAAPVFQAPAIALTKMTPRKVEDSVGARSHAMTSLLEVGAGRQQQKREKREALLQQLQASKAAAEAVASPADFFSDMGMAQTTTTVKAAVRVKHSDLIGASSGGIPLGGTNNARFAAAAPAVSSGADSAAAWGEGGDDDLSDIDLSDDDDDDE